MFKYLLAVLGIFASSVCLAETLDEWNAKLTKYEPQELFVADINLNSNTVTYILINTVEKTSNDVVRFWEFLINKDKTLKFDLQKVYVEMDCANRKFTLPYYVTYLKGKLLTNDVGIINPLLVAPGTVSAIMHDFACSLGKDPNNKKLFSDRIKLYPIDTTVLVSYTQFLLKMMKDSPRK